MSCGRAARADISPLVLQETRRGKPTILGFWQLVQLDGCEPTSPGYATCSTTNFPPGGGNSVGTNPPAHTSRKPDKLTKAGGLAEVKS